VIARSPGARLAGLLGSTRERGQQLADRYPGSRAYASLDELTADDAVEAVWIAGPNKLHAEFAARCLEAGKHVLLEKPMATALDDARELQAVAERSEPLLRIGFQHRFRPGHEWIKHAIAEERYGPLRLIRIHRFWPFPYYPDMAEDASPWRRSLEESGGWALNDIGSHLIDLGMWLAGEQAMLAAVKTANLKFVDAEAEDTVVLILETQSNALVLIDTGIAMASFQGTVEVHGLGGWIRADGTFDSGGSLVASDGTRERFPELTNEDVYVGECSDFVNAVRGGKSHGCTPEEALANVAIVEQAAQQHATQLAAAHRA
jgi:predicted dehydrogenase